MNPMNPGGPPGGYPPGGYPPGGYPPGAPPGGMPPGAPGYGPPGVPPYGMSPPGMGMANMAMARGLGQAQASLKTAGSMLRTMQILFTVVGALMVLGGLGMLFTVAAGGGIGLMVTGVVFVVSAWVMLPKFMGQLGGASAMVNAMQANQQLALTGIPATARVLAMQQTGTMVNMNPQVQATLQVNGPQGPYQVQTLAIVPQMNIPQFQPGCVVNVRVNPTNPNDVAVVF